ncbi:MAG: chorismate mutase [Chthoniobacterales bacterium]
MSDLGELRVKIDKIDALLIDLLNQRAKLALEVGRIKQTTGIPVYAPEREDQLLRGLEKRSNGPLTPEAIRAIYREIMSASLSLETDLVIACAGPETGLTPQAAHQKFGSSIRYLFFPTIPEVFSGIQSKKANYGVVPIETPTETPVRQTLDCLMEGNLSIAAQIQLVSFTGAQHVGRFFVIGNSLNPPSGNDQTSLCIRVHNQPGALVSAIAPLSESSINLIQILTLQDTDGKPENSFYLEIDGHAADPLVRDTIETLRSRCDSVKILGSYPKV